MTREQTRSQHSSDARAWPARRLFICERTVDGHVRSILNKLGFSSRAQIAAWPVGQVLGSGWQPIL